MSECNFLLLYGFEKFKEYYLLDISISTIPGYLYLYNYKIKL